MLRWFWERRARIEVLADALISWRGAEAYAEARWRAHVAGSGAAVATTIARKLCDARGDAGFDEESRPRRIASPPAPYDMPLLAFANAGLTPLESHPLTAPNERPRAR